MALKFRDMAISLCPDKDYKFLKSYFSTPIYHCFRIFEKSYCVILNNKWLWIVLLAGVCAPLNSSLFAQEKNLFRSWEQVRNASPDTVFFISFSKSKLSKLPDSLARFHYLKGLDLSRNNFDELPDFIGSFDSLISIDLSRNQFDIFPIELCRLRGLKRLILNRNKLDELPDCIRYLSALEFLDLWSTPIRTFPAEFKELRNLKTLDLQGNRYSPSFQKQLKKDLPGTTILLDPPCDCME